ncbi:ABC transporter ATP-binding protein [uncultured Lactobacillus sp.]|uniref:ABC transporter ATP-binding protein n=1 Tax=uncultured Lactobacillus sp. TaxID=153152 RepID=UPI00261C356E|nr:ABC transporter ATP-binding protein [uncultured Lactobacillus sp.]
MRTLGKAIFKQYRSKLLFLQILTILNTLVITFNIYLEGMLLNSLVYNQDKSNFFKILILIISLSLSRILFTYFVNRIQILDSRKASLDANNLVIKNLYSKDTLEILKNDPIKLTDQLNDDIYAIITFLFETVSQIVSLILSFAIIFVFLVRTNPIYFWIILGLLAVYTICYFFLKPRMYEVSLRLKNIYNIYFSGLSDWFSRYVEIKGKGTFNQNQANLNKVETKLLKIGKKDFTLNYAMSVLQIGIQLIFQIFLFVWGGLAVIAGRITIGYFSIILQYFNQLLTHADSLFSILVKLEATNVSYKRMSTLLEIKAQKDGDLKLNSVQSIDLKGVNISLGQDKYLFDNTVSYKFQAPGLYAITGKNGVGKSTLLRTISGIYNSQILGDILINGNICEKVDRQDLRKNKMSFVFQDTGIPTCSVGEYLGQQLKEGDSNFTKVFYSEKFNIEKLLATPMDHLSSGELQLVKLYSALTKENVDCLFLDEPLANIHPSMKKDIIKLLQKVAQDHLIIMISHDQEDNLGEKRLEIC